MKMRWIMVARVDADLQIPDSSGQLARPVRLSIIVDLQPIREHSGEQGLHGWDVIAPRQCPLQEIGFRHMPGGRGQALSREGDGGNSHSW